MASLFDFSKAISKLNKEKKFAETLKYFKSGKNEFTPVQIGLNKFIVYEMIYALIETNHYVEVFTFINQYSAVLDPKNFSYLLKRLKDKPSMNWTFVSKFCDLVSVDSLDTECRSIEVENKGEKKLMELASSKEDWYSAKTKALFEIQNYQECFDLSKVALESFNKFHYSNEVWFARRIALSKKHLGNSTEALHELLLILKRKKEWFIQNEVAQLYMENGDHENAFKFAILAINNYGDLEYKVKVLELIGKLLLLKDQNELSFKHYSLLRLLSLQEKRIISNSVTLALSQFSNEQIAMEKLPELRRDLKKYWLSFNQSTSSSKINAKQIYTGRIDKILHNDEKGADGFIKFDGNKSVYFRVSTTDDIIKKIVIGLEVEFIILPAINDKKEKAVQLRIKQ